VLWIRIGFNADSDPAFLVNADPDPDLMTKKWEKLTAEKIYVFLIKNWNLLISRAPERTSKLQEKSLSLKRERPQFMTLNFCLLFWI
jgi:hypothetical protein